LKTKLKVSNYFSSSISKVRWFKVTGSFPL